MTTATATARPPAQPSYIFRGHAVAIHSVQIVRRNTRLLTGDAEGWIVLWKLESKRPVAVWKAHEAAILGTGEWMDDRILTHGRDNALRIWQLRTADEEHMSKVLPADDLTALRPEPWLLHTLPANTLNFCAFSMCLEPQTPGRGANQAAGSIDPILVAVPARDDKKIEVYRFPDERLLHVVPNIESKNAGMVMAVKLAFHRPSNNMLVLVGYEGGFTAVHVLTPPSQGEDFATSAQFIQLARPVYLSQPHTQPVLSVDASPDAKIYYTSSADAVIAAHRVPDLPFNNIGTGDAVLEKSKPPDQVPDNAAEITTQAGGTADPEPLVLSEPHTHDNDSGIPASESLTFAKQPISTSQLGSSSTRSKPTTVPTSKPSALSSLLSSSSAPPNTAPSPVRPLTVEQPHKTTNTKHSGQQSLQVRSDGRIFITGGWDSKVRIYSAKTLKEVAVLKWHKEGVYAAAFGAIIDDTENREQSSEVKVPKGEMTRKGEGGGALTGLGKLQKQREKQIQGKRWVVAGAKDGKVSLWEVF